MFNHEFISCFMNYFNIVKKYEIGYKYPKKVYKTYNFIKLKSLEAILRPCLLLSSNFIKLLLLLNLSAALSYFILDFKEYLYFYFIHPYHNL
jgi:hypothetical protein